MVFEIVGREAELASLNAFIDGMEGGAGALVLEGEAGVGKSTLWGAAVEHARVRGLTVLSSRPAEAERGLGNVGLGDLLEGVVDDVLGLDPSSSRALGFALRRLDASPVIVLLARRLVEGAQQSELERALGPDRVRRLIVGPLSVGALHRFLRDRLQRPFPRQTLLRIHERSGGNPFFALELASVLPADVDPLQPLPVPETVEEVVGAGISALPGAVREALALAAAVGTASESLLRRVGVATDALDAAVAARVVERENGMIRFTHPLLSSVLYDDLGEERRAVHARIAEVVEEPVLRARHLALSTETPDADVARLLDDAATLASDRGAPAATAELAEHALRLTPRDQAAERRRRALAAAHAHLAAGEWTRARSIATDLLAGTRGPPRAEALLVLAEFEHDDLAVPLLEEAVREAASHPPLQALIHIRLAAAERFRKGFAGALDGTRAALVLADRVNDDVLRFKALAQMSWLGGMVGDAEAPEYRQRALDIATASGDARMLREANALRWRMLIDAGSIDSARATLEHEHREWQERDEPFDAHGI